MFLQYGYTRACSIFVIVFVSNLSYLFSLKILDSNTVRKAPNRRTQNTIEKFEPGYVRTEFCDYLPGNSLINQDDDKICTSDQLEYITGKWIRRDFKCNWKKWYEKIDPLGQSKLYDNKNNKDIYNCAKRDSFMKNLIGSRHRFVPKNCILLRFNPSHALEMVNNGCTSPMIFLGDNRIKNLAESWKKLVGSSNENDQAIVEYHKLKHFEPLTWLRTLSHVKTLVISFLIIEETKSLGPMTLESVEQYEAKVEKILTTIDKSPISKVIFFISPKHVVVKSVCELDKYSPNKKRLLMVKNMWKKLFNKFDKTSFSILDVTEASQSWPGAEPFIENGKCNYCLPGVPDTWSHILFNVLHKSHIGCQIKNFEAVSKHVTLHEALYGAMDA